MKNYYHRDNCRLCGCTKFELVLPIRPSPIGDAFISKEQLNEVQDLYPLDTYLCLDCGHLQNLDVVDPELLFRNYTYHTSSSMGLVKHFENYAKNIVKKLKLPAKSLIVEIGSNDGSLMKAFKKQDMQVLGVDPAKSIAEAATSEGVNTIPEFFTSTIADQIIATTGNAKIICANNVFAHADNIEDIVKGIRKLLSKEGVFVFEVSYVLDMIDNLVFDTIYHEHVSHHALLPLERFFNKFEMTIFDVERIDTKGGSIRCYAQILSSGINNKTKNYFELIEKEKQRKILSPIIYQNFFQAIENRKKDLNEYIDKEIKQGKTVIGYGASTTTTTLLYHFELQSRIKYIVDDNKNKNNLYSPNSHIPIYSSETINCLPSPDTIIIFAWQYAEKIISRNKLFLNNGGKFLIPLPNLKIVSRNNYE
jgi:SAM-dependent methyltransferase